MNKWNNIKTWWDRVHKDSWVVNRMGYRRNYLNAYDDLWSNEILDLQVTHIECSCCTASTCPGRPKVQIPIANFKKQKSGVGKEIFEGGPEGWFRKAGCFIGNRGRCMKHPAYYSDFIYGKKCQRADDMAQKLGRRPTPQELSARQSREWPECYLLLE